MKSVDVYMFYVFASLIMNIAMILVGFAAFYVIIKFDLMITWWNGICQTCCLIWIVVGILTSLGIKSYKSWAEGDEE